MIRHCPGGVVRNILVVNERRDRIAPAESDVFLGELTRLPIRMDNTPERHRVMTLSRAHGLTSYDAVYLEVAVRLNAPLATLGRALARAAQAERLHLI